MHLTLVPHPGTDEMKHSTVRVSPLFGLAPAGVPPSVAAFVARTTLIVMAANFAVGSVLVLAPGGASPALEFLRHIAPLPAWGLVFALVGALGMLGRLVIAHAVAVALWAFLALVLQRHFMIVGVGVRGVGSGRRGLGVVDVVA
ncbi:hypothetical protein SAMN05443637_13530, partial [Pseudonocardia thermophila]